MSAALAGGTGVSSAGKLFDLAMRGLRCLPLCVGLIQTLSAQAQAPQECRPFISTQDTVSGLSGFSPEEVCQQMVARKTPHYMNGGTVAGHITYIGTIQVNPAGWHCSVEYRSVSVSSGEFIPSESGFRTWDGVIGPVCEARKILLTGADRTKALPAGLAVPYIATVTANNSPVSGASVSVDIAGAGQASIQGVTDGAGQFHFLYVPPFLRATVDQIRASCVGCSNTEQKQITVEACDVCDR